MNGRWTKGYLDKMFAGLWQMTTCCKMTSIYRSEHKNYLKAESHLFFSVDRNEPDDKNGQQPLLATDEMLLHQ
jgi:hypothetical protein